MAKTVQQKKFCWQAHKPLLATALAVAGVFNMVGAVVAEGTAAGETISNTATATYEDDNGSIINATSNTVDIQVAEVAGLVAVSTGINDVDGDAVEDGDVLEYFFEVTNTGNAETNVFIPGIDGVNGADLPIDPATGAPNPLDKRLNATSVEIVTIDAAGAVTSVQTISDSGSTGGALTTTAVGANETITIRVTGTPEAGTRAGENVVVTLGNVPPNNNSDGTQNQPFTANGVADLYTEDSDGTLTPVNGVREASATQDISFASSVNPLAFATVLKNSSQVVNNPASTTDDLITYGLGLRVEDDDPTSVYQPAALAGTPLVVGSNPATDYVLVSDAIPAGTVFSSVGQNLPPGWRAIYSTSPLANADPLDSATTVWSRTQPTNLAAITRVGFINATSLAAGSEVSADLTAPTGLRFTVVTTNLDPLGGTVNNIAQVFGSTAGGDPTQVIYDESGDTTPNNNTPPTNGTNYTPPDSGVADPANDGVDPGNDNTGDNTDNNGEVNQLVISPTTDDILNGPSGTPSAVGPNNDNDDFTNDSTDVPAGLKEGDTFTPSSVTFTNTISNPTAGRLANVAIQPLSTVEAAAISATGYYGVDDPNTPAIEAADNANVPNGTIVTIRYDDGTAVQSAEYTYDGITFGLTDGAIVNVGDILPNTPGNNTDVTYTVEVLLPPNTTQVLDEVPIPIVAFPEDSVGTSPGFSNEVTNNITIDRVYTGFMKLVKQARILDADGTTVLVPFGETFDPDVVANQIRPGQIIEYKIDYSNISTNGAGAGAGNVTMNARNFKIVEDGTIQVVAAGADPIANPAVANNWAAFTTHQVGTNATTGSILYREMSGGSSVTAEPASGSDVEVYENEVGTVAPNRSGNFIFRRVVD